MPKRSPACTCNRLRRASRAMTQVYDEALASSHLRVTQFALLNTLARGGPWTIGLLAQALLLDRTALSRNVDPLVERGLVAVEHGADARTRVLALTPAGREAIAQAEPHWRAAQQRIAQALGPERLDTLYALLDDVERLHPAAQAAQGSA